MGIHNSTAMQQQPKNLATEVRRLIDEVAKLKDERKTLATQKKVAEEEIERLKTLQAIDRTDIARLQKDFKAMVSEKEYHANECTKLAREISTLRSTAPIAHSESIVKENLQLKSKVTELQGQLDKLHAETQEVQNALQEWVSIE